MLKIDSREALDSIRVQAKEVIDNSKCRILICAGTGCLAGGSAQIHEKMLELVNANPNIEVHFVSPLSLSVSCHIGPGSLALAMAVNNSIK